jgi:hypothetical protein
VRKNSGAEVGSDSVQDDLAGVRSRIGETPEQSLAEISIKVCHLGVQKERRRPRAPR